MRKLSWSAVFFVISEGNSICQEECNTEYKRKDGLDLFADFLGEMILKYADKIDIASPADPVMNKEETSRKSIKDESIEND